VQASLQIPEVKDRMSKIGLDPVPPMSVEAYSARLVNDVAKWGKVVRDAKLKPQ
jgi:hypothetical protein